MKHWKDFELETFILSLTLFESDFNKMAEYLYSQNQSNKSPEQCQELWELIYKNLPLVALAMSANTNYQTNQDLQNHDQNNDINSVNYDEDGVAKNDDFHQPNQSSNSLPENYCQQVNLDVENYDDNNNEENLNDNNLNDGNLNIDGEDYDDESYDEDNLEEDDYEFVDRENGDQEEEYDEEEDIVGQDTRLSEDQVKNSNSIKEARFESENFIPDVEEAIKEQHDLPNKVAQISSTNSSETEVSCEPTLPALDKPNLITPEESSDESILRKRVASEIENELIQVVEDSQNKKRCI